MNNNLSEYLSHNKSISFNELLFSFIDRSGMKDSDVYKSAQIDRKLFSKIRCGHDYIPSRNNIIKLCLALKLNSNDFNSLLNSAGYTLTKNNNDLIISYLVNNGVYDIDTVNNYLYSYSGTVL